VRTGILSPWVLAPLALAACSTFVPGTTPPEDASAELPDTDLGFYDAAVPEPIRPCITEDGGVLTPGTFPDPTCDDSTGQCPAAGGCAIDTAQCGSPETCLPLTTYASAPETLRIRDLHVVAPPTLAGVLIADEILDSAIDLDAAQCGETGNGTFNWLLTVDEQTASLTTGAAPVPSDAFGVGYCFYEKPAIDGFSVTPEKTALTVSGSTFTSAPIPSLNLPIFGGTGGAAAYLFPLSNVVFQDVALSAGGDCIGSFNPDALDVSCNYNPGACSKWNTGGVVGGFIKLCDADQSLIPEIGESLCVFLTGSAADSTGHCYPESLSLGDYCSTTLTAGGCQDSLWFAATFAASAVKVDASGTNASCAP